MTAAHTPLGRTAAWAQGLEDVPTSVLEADTRGADRDAQLAGALGWFSVGLGLAQLIAPRGFTRAIGLCGDPGDQNLTRLVGLRELACGVGLLVNRRRPAPWLWARAAGDAMDLAMLGGSIAGGAPHPDRTAAAALAVVGVTALDVREAMRFSQRPHQGLPAGDVRGSFQVNKAITIGRSPQELYTFWRNLENLPRFMAHLESVQVLNPRRSRWKAKAPAGMSVEWEAEILEDRPNEWIAWRSVEGSEVANSGSVGFVPAPGGRGTEVRVHLQYDPPLGALGVAVAKLFGESPEQQLQDDLRIFKQVIETGEPVYSPSSHKGEWLVQRPAQPAPGPSF